MNENRLTAIALTLSLGMHIAIIGASGGFSSLQDKQLLQTKTQISENKKTSLLPEIRIIGEFKQLKSADGQQSIDYGQKDETENNEDQNLNKAEIKRLLTVDHGPLTAGQEFIAPDEASEAMLRYQDTVKQKIESSRHYPMRAQRMGLEGVVDIAFVINKDGTSRNIKVVGSSGSKLLDAEALNNISKANPFMPLPQAIGRSSVDIRVAIVFSLN